MLEKMKLSNTSISALLEKTSNVFSLCEILCIETFRYSESYTLLNKLGLTDHTLHNDGFIVEAGIYLLIFYNDFLPYDKQQRIIAHELGHYLMEHPKAMKQLNPKITEQEAALFAETLLSKSNE